MEREKYDDLFNNDEVVKYTDWSGRHYRSENGILVVVFFFAHRGYPDNYSSNPERRISLSVFPIENLNVEIPLYQVKNDFLVLANTDFPDYALTYRIKINEDAKSAKVLVEDYPLLGESLVTADEKTGLAITFNR